MVHTGRTRLSVYLGAVCLLFCSLPLAAQAPPVPFLPSGAITVFGGIPFTTGSLRNVIANEVQKPTQYTLGAALEWHIFGPLSVQPTLAVAKVDQPEATPGVSGGTLLSADLDFMLTLPNPGGIKPYLIAGPGLIHLQGGSNAVGMVIGGGLKIPLGFGWELRPELRFEPVVGTSNQFAGTNRFTIGLSHTF